MSSADPKISMDINFMMEKKCLSHGNWIWLDGDSSDDYTNTSDVEENDKLDGCDDDDLTAGISVPAIIHSVIFKCIGILKEDFYQEVLALANKRNEGVDMPIKLENRAGR